MNDDSVCLQIETPGPSIVRELALTDLDADQQLLALPGTSLLVFTSQGCASCRYARQALPGLELPVERLVWIDAGENPGLAQRYEVFHLPALFVVRDGLFYGALHSRLQRPELERAILQALARNEDDLP